MSGGGPRGFALIEVALVLAIMAVTGSIAWAVVAKLRPVAEAGRVVELMHTADLALHGHVLVHHRLPCPDVSGDGREGDDAGNCTGASAGMLPWRSLGMAAPTRLRYGVHRTAATDLVVAMERYTPEVALSVPLAPQVDGLDFCVALRNGLRDAGTTGLAGGVRAAYVVTHAGALDDGRYDLPEGEFALPGSPAVAGHDDQTLAVGTGELLSRLRCPARWGQIDGAARAADAAVDLVRYAGSYRRFREVVVAMREVNLEIARSNLELAIANQVIAIATAASSLALASVSGGIGAGSAAGAAAAVTAAAAALAAAVIAVDDAEDLFNTALEQLAVAVAFQTRANGILDRATTRVRSQHASGLRP